MSSHVGRLGSAGGWRKLWAWPGRFSPSHQSNARVLLFLVRNVPHALVTFGLLASTLPLEALP